MDQKGCDPSVHGWFQVACECSGQKVDTARAHAKLDIISQATRHQVVFAPHPEGVYGSFCHTAMDYTALKSLRMRQRYSPQALIQDLQSLVSLVSAPRISSFRNLHCYHHCSLINTCNFIHIVLF